MLTPLLPPCLELTLKATTERLKMHNSSSFVKIMLDTENQLSLKVRYRTLQQIEGGDKAEVLKCLLENQRPS
jgi:hypothetical protein